jgi:exopolyphosphatase/guanosine-5'-triphosphate,3'-diphosphate pyrophosphatase
MKLVTPRVAVIDIGSNSIKALVANRHGSGQIIAIDQRTLDSRISSGIGQNVAALSEKGMVLGVDSVAELLKFIAPYAPQEIRIVATSAVRDAQNGSNFQHRLKQRTGHDLQILSGDEEAEFIGRGLLCDPALRAWENFNVFDLGGGSMECVSFENRRSVHALSLPLGCVRLTEKLIANPEAALSAADADTVRRYVQDALIDAAIPFINSAGRAVFTGGTMTSCRVILAEAKNITLAETSSQLSIELIAAILKKLGRLPLPERREIAGLPDRRADVMPVALVTVLALAAAGKFTSFQHSFYNLRWGVADSLLPLPQSD